MKTNFKSESIFVIDCVIFGFDEGELKILLKERKEDPYTGYWNLPVYVTDPNEHVEEAAKHALFQLTGVNDIFMEQYYTVSSFERHPTTRVVSAVYYGMVRLNNIRDLQRITAYTSNAAWFSIDELPALAFDQGELLEKMFQKLRRKILYHPLALELLPEKFTLTQLQNLYEVILKKKLDKRNFRKKALSYGILKDLNEKQKDVSYRAAKLFKFEKMNCENSSVSESLVLVEEEA